MNILLVDDDRFIIKALQETIHWEALGIEQVYTASSLSQAQAIIQSHPIALMISDIEMPQGSGLDLLAWVRSEKYDIQTIFLTNYADFNYAQNTPASLLGACSSAIVSRISPWISLSTTAPSVKSKARPIATSASSKRIRLQSVQTS